MTPKEIERRQQLALENHAKGYNCAQCVALSACDLVGIDPDTAFRCTEGFGGGMGDYTQTCGAISGGIFIVSAKNSSGRDPYTSKMETYRLAAELRKQFAALHDDRSGCGDLRPWEKELVMPTCNGYICDMVKLTCEMLDTIQ